MKVLIAEDQEETASFLVKALKNNGFVPDWEREGDKALWKARFTDYDIFICDQNLPVKNGLEILKNLRKNKINIPFIMLTVESRMEVKLKSFKLGADDYLVKPFLLSELIARMKAVCRRESLLARDEVFEVRGISVNNLNFKVFKDRKEIKLRRKEYDLLYFLMKNTDRVISRARLLEKVWDMNTDPFTNTVDVHIQNLRRKLGDKKGKVIRTVYGRGYELLSRDSKRK